MGIPLEEVNKFIYLHWSSIGWKKVMGPCAEKEVVEQVLFLLLNNGLKILEEGIGVIYLYGYGWPAWKGGPMQWLDTKVGMPCLLKWLEEMNILFPRSSYYISLELLVVHGSGCYHCRLLCEELG